jgi:cytoskeletal protein CcmA (bactofilin family)
MAKQYENEPNGHNQISVGTTITGDIISEFDIRIDGKLVGNLDTKGKLVLGPSGTVNGNIQCKNSVVEGKIEGKISVSELLTLKSTAFIQGDIITNKLAIEPGSKFIGNCDMSGAEKNHFNAGAKEQDKGKTDAKKDK